MCLSDIFTWTWKPGQAGLVVQAETWAKQNTSEMFAGDHWRRERHMDENVKISQLNGNPVGPPETSSITNVDKSLKEELFCQAGEPLLFVICKSFLYHCTTLNI